VVAVGRNDYAVEVVAVGRNDYVVEVMGVVVDEGFGYAVELRALDLTGGRYRGCIASLRASLTRC
jgi:hypothetical protein